MEGGGGHFTKNEVSLNYNAFVEHGENVDVVCHTGYFPKGPPRLRCWYGEWSGGASSVFGMPKCVGNPCNLPEISGTPGGKYVGKLSLIHCNMIIGANANTGAIPTTRKLPFIGKLPIEA